MKTLTNQELKQKASNYDKVQNEGGEGYNPYRTEIERREIEVCASNTRTKKDQIDELYHKIKIECGSVSREWGNPEEIDAKQAEYYAKIKKLEEEFNKEENIKFEIEWTLEETKTRRAEWNDFIRSLMDSNGKLDKASSREIYKRQGQQGWGIDVLKKAIAIHDLG